MSRQNVVSIRSDVPYPTLPRVFATGEKKLNFIVSDSGDFVDNIYRETEANSVLGIFMGRSNNIAPFHKKFFTAADVIREGYLHKRGSWWKSWKKRYFVLRKDIRALCYFDSKESLKLLGSIPLSTSTYIQSVHPQQADNQKFVLEIQPWGLQDASHTRVLIRAESVEELQAWESDLVDEATNTMEIKSDSNGDWWSNVMDRIPEAQGISTSARRGQVYLTPSPTASPESRQHKIEPKRPISQKGSAPIKIDVPTSPKEQDLILEQSVPQPMTPYLDIVEDSPELLKEYQDDENTDDDDDGDVIGQESSVVMDDVDGMDMKPSTTGVLATLSSPDDIPDNNGTFSDYHPVNPVDDSTSTSSTALSSSSSQRRNSPSNLVTGGDDNMRSAFSRLSVSAQRNILKLHSGAEEELAAIRRFALNNKAMIQANRMRKQLYFKVTKDKPAGLPPFRYPLIDRFESSGKLIGVQLSVNLMNICGFQDRIFAAIFAGTTSMTADEAAHACNENRIAASRSGSSWKQLSLTEIMTIDAKPAYGANYVDLVRLHFSLLQEPLPKDCKYVMVAIYRCDSSDTPQYESSKKKVEQAKFSNMVKDELNTKFSEDLSPAYSHLQQHQAIARSVIPIRNWNEYPIFYSQMKVLLDAPVDVSSPMASEPRATLGVMKLTSGTLQQHRKKLIEAHNHNPYAETMYSFQTTTGQTLSIEQIFASSYGVAVPGAMIKFIQLDRGPTISKLYAAANRHVETLATEIKLLQTNHSVVSGTPPMHAGNRHSISTLANIDNFANHTSIETQYLTGLMLGYELILQAADIIRDIQDDFQSAFMAILENCQSVSTSTYSSSSASNSAVSNGHAEVGMDSATDCLRKSAWKKIPQWQFSATNLNLHVLISRHFNYDEMISHTDRLQASSKQSSPSAALVKSPSPVHPVDPNPIHAIPTITLGVPAAHGLRFKEGGLKSIFEGISDPDSILLWMHMIQSDVPWADFFAFMNENEHEANILFGGKAAIPAGVSTLTDWQLEIASSSSVSSNTTSSSLTVGKDILREIYTMRRKMELAQRIDIVSSQVLAYALTHVRSLIILATHIGGSYIEILQRSLKIGFVLVLESLLSTIGDELGMIEDAEIAVQWLSLVTLRLVSSATPSPSSASKPRDYRQYHDKVHKIAKGSSSGVTIRRDLVGRIIVDLELPPDEVETVQLALASMAEFNLSANARADDLERKSMSMRYSVAIYHDIHPNVLYADQEIEPDVHAIIELHGVLFTQGINEMQTFANISQSRDTVRQVEINKVAIERLEAYFDKYLVALSFQMHKAMLETPYRPRSQTTASNTSTSASTPSSPMPNPHTSTNLSRPVQISKINPSLQTAIRRSLLSHSGTSSPGPHTSSSTETDQYTDLMSSKAIQSVVRLLEEAKAAVRKQGESPMEKHVDVILKLSALSRKLGGTIGILCKSGKDRTGMGVTLETTRAVVEDLGVRGAADVCHVLRTHGVRRMNVYTNTGQSKFAFNRIQRTALPTCYRPPVGTFAGNVLS